MFEMRPPRIVFPDFDVGNLQQRIGLSNTEVARHLPSRHFVFHDLTHTQAFLMFAAAAFGAPGFLDNGQYLLTLAAERPDRRGRQR